MSESPTHKDAELILRLYELRREERMRAGRERMAQPENK